MHLSHRGAVIGVGIATLALTSTGVATAKSPHGAEFPSSGSGPSTTVDPYVVPVSGGVGLASLLTVDDLPADNGVGMVGIPDGLGAFAQGRNLVVYMNHELRDSVGAVRAHGQRGAFVSRNVIDPRTGRVKETTDLIQTVRYWDYPSQTWVDTPTSDGAAFNRFCSASLTDPGMLYDAATKTGYKGQVFFGNEESGNEGRDFGVTKDGVASQLPRLGKFSWENTLVAPGTGTSTVAIGTEDGGDGQLRIYVGSKQRSGTAVEKAGLNNGELHVLDVANQLVSTDAGYRAAYPKGTAVPVLANEVNWNATGAVQNVEAAAKGLQLNRIEDGAFDPSHPNDFYFLTTEGGGKLANPAEPTFTRDGGGLWRLRFADVSDPSKGMTLTLMLDGTEAPYLSKPDNMDIDRRGHLLIQEDPGNNAHVARIVAYDIASGALRTLAQFDPAVFSGATALTLDEESSGIIDVEELLGAGWFLLDAQVHTPAGLSDPGTQVENGQLLSMKVDWSSVF
ncbi:MAG: DUF839 domain-containing protein [Nocardioidaceae bacterium]|nr:DUF839 domain-containing protein [Nocardioidaceae bacterium]